MRPALSDVLLSFALYAGLTVVPALLAGTILAVLGIPHVATVVAIAAVVGVCGVAGRCLWRT